MGHVQEERENAGNAQTMRSTCGRLCRPIVISCSSSGILRLWLGKLPERQGHARGHPLVDQGRRGAGPRSLIPLSQRRVERAVAGRAPGPARGDRASRTATGARRGTLERGGRRDGLAGDDVRAERSHRGRMPRGPLVVRRVGGVPPGGTTVRRQRRPRACPPVAAESRSWDLRRGVAFERQDLSTAAAPGRHDASAAAAFGRCNGPAAVEQERGPPRDRGDRGRRLHELAEAAATSAAPGLWPTRRRAHLRSCCGCAADGSVSASDRGGSGDDEPRGRASGRRGVGRANDLLPG